MHADDGAPEGLPTGAPMHSGGAPRLLVVDDEEAIRSVLARFFTRRGWLVEEADDGRVALERLLGGTAAVDYVISDVRMPSLSGVELRERLAAERPALLPRLILTTGDVLSSGVPELIERTGVPVLEKPFEMDELSAMERRMRESLGLA